MNAHGNLRQEHALDARGEAITAGPEYMRSFPINSINLSFPPESRVTWFSIDQVNSGHFRFNPHEEDRVIQVSQAQGAYFQAHCLTKVNNLLDGDKEFLPRDEFYPAMHKMLREQIAWESNFRFYGRATFQPFVMEWTETILHNFGDILHQAGIFGAVAVSRYSYDCCSNVWRAFCELWGPLSNTFHHGNGEMSISLYDLKVIGGLPILGLPYDEFIPPNEELCREDLYPSSVGELLRIHAQLHNFHRRGQVYYNHWVEHFFRGEAVYGATGNGKNVIPKQVAEARKLPLNISHEGQLAAFLAFWLSYFVMPTSKAIRPECFYMASLMARGFKVSLAPAVLGVIYHALGTVATHPRGPGLANACLPIHYVLGWLGEHFPDLTTRRCDSDFPEHYPLLARYSHIEAKNVTPTQARIVFRSDSAVYRPSVFLAHEDYTLLDTETLADDIFEYLICMRSALLPVRVGGDLWLEPYYPNRFARQFGFDQGVPANRLSFSVCERQRCGIEKLARAQATLLRKNTTARFYIPRSTRIGECSWWYCRWWMAACAPYMCFSVSKIFSIVDRHVQRRDHVFVTDDLKRISTSMSKRGLNSSSPPHGASSSRGHKKRIRNAKGQHFSGVNPVIHQSQRANRDSHLKRARHENHNGVEDGGTSHVPDEESSNPVQGDMRLDDISFPREMEPINAGNPVFEIISSGEEESILHESANSNMGDSGFDPLAAESEPIQNSLVDDQFPEGVGPIAIVRPLQNLVSVENFVCQIFGNEVNQSRREFIIREIEGIFSRLSSSETPTQLHMHHSEIIKGLRLLGSTVDILGCGGAAFNQFAQLVDWIFELARRHSKSSAYIEALGDVNADVIHDLIRQHEECLNTKLALETELTEVAKEIEDLDINEATIREAEERVRHMREEHEAKKTSLHMQKMNLEISLEHQNEQTTQLQQSRIDAKEHLLPQIGSTRLSMKAQEREIRRLINALFSSCSEL
ncbi:unnamed protein product [Prunus brigantina]